MNFPDNLIYHSMHAENKIGVIRNLFCNEFETFSINFFRLKTLRKTSLENADRIPNVSYESTHNFERLQKCLRNALSTLKIFYKTLEKV